MFKISPHAYMNDFWQDYINNTYIDIMTELLT